MSGSSNNDDDESLKHTNFSPLCQTLTKVLPKTSPNESHFKLNYPYFIYIRYI